MAEYKTKLQNNITWGETFKMGRKAPAVANRIFLTLADAQDYVDNINDSATEGIRISVINDTTTENNGLYYVKAIGDGENPGILVQLGRGSAAWYKGNAVSEDGTEYHINGASEGDIYMNSDTLDTYILQSDGKWKKVGNMVADKVNRTVPYYKLSVNGSVHPVFDIEECTWIEGDDDGSNIPDNYEEIGAEAGNDYHGQIYLWTRFYDEEETKPKYTVAMVYSSLNLGMFELED